MLHGKLKSSVAILGVSQIASAALRFIRVVIIARVLLPEDFGIAATFWITTGVLMAITEIGLEKIIIQDDKGDESHFGSVAQLLFIVRGILLATILLVFAPDIATFFDAPEATNEFRLLALLPLLTGLQHRDLIRKQRTMEFKPYVLATVVPEFVITLSAYPVALFFADYRAFVYLSILSGIFKLLISFKLAERPFLVAWDTAIFRKAMKFGWPLMINGMLMLLTLQGDKLIISQFYSKEALGFFAIAFGFATMVPNSLGTVTTQVVLPYLSRLKGDRELLDLNLVYFYRVILLISLSVIVVVMFHGEIITKLIYGDRYLDSAVLIKIITVVFFVRLLRQLPNTLAIVYSNTWMVMISNIVRQVSILAALALALSGADLIWIASSGLVGEILAFVVIVVLHKRVHEYATGLWLKPLGLFSLVLLISAAVVDNFNEYEYFLYYLPVSIAVVFSSAYWVRKTVNEQIASQS